MAHRNYRPTVEGERKDEFRLTFDAITFTRIDRNTAPAGDVGDQAQLQGPLRRVSDLGLTPLEVRAVRTVPMT